MGDETIDLEARRAALQRQIANQTLRDLPDAFADIGHHAWWEMTDPRMLRTGMPLPWINTMTQLLRETGRTATTPREPTPDEAAMLREKYGRSDGGKAGRPRSGFPSQRDENVGNSIARLFDPKGRAIWDDRDRESGNTEERFGPPKEPSLWQNLKNNWRNDVAKPDMAKPQPHDPSLLPGPREGVQMEPLVWPLDVLDRAPYAHGGFAALRQAPRPEGSWMDNLPRAQEADRGMEEFLRDREPEVLTGEGASPWAPWRDGGDYYPRTPEINPEFEFQGDGRKPQEITARPPMLRPDDRVFLGESPMDEKLRKDNEWLQHLYDQDAGKEWRDQGPPEGTESLVEYLKRRYLPGWRSGTKKPI